MEVKAADPITEGSINPNEILAIKGPEGVFEYLVQEVQKYIEIKVLISMINISKLLVDKCLKRFVLKIMEIQICLQVL